MVAMAYVLVLAIVALEVPLALSLRQRLDAEVRQQARSNANVVAVLAGSALKPKDAATLQRIVEISAEDVRGRIAVVDHGGTVVADSTGSAGVGTTLASRPEVKIALSGRGAQITRNSRTLGRELLATAVPIVQAGKVRGAVRVTQDVADVAEAYRHTLAGLALIGAAVLAVGLIAGAIIARQITRPLRRFEATARAVADGDLQARAPVEGSTEQRELATTFNEMTDRLAGSLEAQSRFVADASHQLRTPLTGLRLRLEGARAGSSDAAVNEQIDHGLDEVDRLARTVEELLLLSQTGERDARAERLQLAQVVRDAEHRWRPIAESGGHALVVNVGGEQAVDASRGDLQRILDALIENALSYSREGTAVELVLSGRQICVKDGGPGIGDGDSEKLFERFYRGSAGVAKSGGTGLGLAIARELARRWHAEVTIANRPEGGAVATLTFSSSREQVA